jgi:hypothetical protein
MVISLSRSAEAGAFPPPRTFPLALRYITARSWIACPRICPIGNQPVREGVIPWSVARWRQSFTRMREKVHKRSGSKSSVFLSLNADADRERFVLIDAPRGS